MISMWEEIEDIVRPTKQRCKCYCFYYYSYSRINITTTPTNKEAFNGWRYNNKYISISTGCLSCSLQIQIFSQNQFLFSPIENQIIIKKEWHKNKNDKDNDNDNSNHSNNNNSKVTHTATTTTVVAVLE